jgi:hypothetical protein
MFIKQLIIHFSPPPLISSVLGQNITPNLPSLQTVVVLKNAEWRRETGSNNWVQLTAGVVWN